MRYRALSIKGRTLSPQMTHTQATPDAAAAGGRRGGHMRAGAAGRAAAARRQPGGFHPSGRRRPLQRCALPAVAHDMLSLLPCVLSDGQHVIAFALGR